MSDFFKKATAQKGLSNSLSNNKNTVENVSVPWVEKYRPKRVDEVVYQDETVAVLKKCIKGADLPNILFYGPPGTGKTSAAIALCRQLFPTPTIYKNRVLEMNASDERGIDVVRHRIKDFSHLAVSDDIRKGKANVPLKIIILDEADAMTAPAQAALRRTMENESRTTRFFLICNYVTRIIEPLTSRCAKFRFKPLSLDAQRQRLEYICECENVKIDKDAIDALVEISNGDLRKSITLLQSIAATVINNESNNDSGDVLDKTQKISAADVREMSGYVPDEEINNLLMFAQTGNIKSLYKGLQSFIRLGYSAYQVISQLADVLLKSDMLEAKHKTKIFTKLGKCEKCLLDGADEFLQLLDILSLVQNCFLELDN